MHYKYKIFNLSDKYTFVENEIIKKINENAYDFINLNLVDFAKKINCSKSSISRIVKLLDFSTLTKMKLYVQEKIIINSFYYDIDDNQNTIQRINNIKSYNNYSINKTIENLNIKKIKIIVSNIVSSKKIHIFGIGSSYLAAIEFANNLQKIGFNVSHSHDIHNSILILSNFNENDCLILFSKSGTTKEINFLINEFNVENNIKIILITSNNNFKETKNLSIIQHQEINKKYRIIATSSKIIQLIISDILFYEIFFLKKQIDNSLKETIEKLEKWKKFK